METVRDRHELLRTVLPHDAVVAEVGVCDGDFARMIYDITSPARLHLIDIWAGIGAIGAEATTDEVSTARIQAVSQRFLPEIKEHRVMLHQGYSTDVLYLFPNGYFDWVYVDGDHSFDGVVGDLVRAAPKVRRGGFLAGHDYCLPEHEHITHRFDDISKAVETFCLARKWKITYLTESRPADTDDPDGQRSPSYVLERA
jgi:hypothetical protein